jgi:hypothetical protein
MSKMGSHDPFGHLKHKLWPKEGSRVKLAIWLQTTKSRELPQFPCVQMACDIPLEISQWRIQRCFKPHLNRRSTHKVMGPQSCRNPHCGSPRTKWHLDAGPVAKHIIYYKGEGGGFPRVQAVVSLVNPCLPMTNIALPSFIYTSNFSLVH